MIHGIVIPFGGSHTLIHGLGFMGCFEDRFTLRDVFFKGVLMYWEPQSASYQGRHYTLFNDRKQKTLHMRGTQGVCLRAQGHRLVRPVQS